MRVRAFLLVLLGLAGLLAWLQYRLWFGVGGTTQVEELRGRVEAQARQNEGLQQRNDALAAEVADLKSGEAAIEERARGELGMIKPGETFYRVVDDARLAPLPAEHGLDPDAATRGEAP
ncbi:cell division protein FtsB [Lysobacteraceae bacterium NML93-0792]|nr:cell division protein FtsB [Xanthomonadaceae bacterium NML93-0792]PBS15577.1 cell division protein FtsB [Xanthomonadaceae bacterium NML93-0793]PBS18271.1 cell division protein FtsB [Xanthomonadaceae bacterium NML93-0831]